jgi:hypothetical protein
MTLVTIKPSCGVRAVIAISSPGLEPPATGGGSGEAIVVPGLLRADAVRGVV